MTKLIAGSLGLLCLCVVLVRSQAFLQQDDVESYTKVGQLMPSFTVTDLGGTQINIGDLKGKVVLVNFWATWCHPCLVELPRLEKQVWRRFKSDDFVMIAIAREQSDKDVAAFKKKRRLTFPMAADPQREIYKLFGPEGLPRSYVVGSDGKILYQTVGYAPSEFVEMTRIIEKELAKVQKAKLGE